MLPLQFSSKVCVLRSRYFKNWCFPNQEDTTSLLWFKSQKTAQTFFNLLIAWDFITQWKNWRSPTTKMTWIPLITDQCIPAWFPTPWRDEDQYISFDLNKQLIPDINATTILKVSWESMIDAWILPWDYVIVHHQTNPSSWALIVAILDGGYTLKYFHQDDTWDVYLTAANSTLFPDPRYPKHSLEVFWVVTWVFRQF